MPLKIICAKCNETMYSMTAEEMIRAIIPIPDIIYDALQGKCPKCGRKISSEDLENYTLKITGEKATSRFFEKYAQKHLEKSPVQRELNQVGFTTEKKGKARTNLVVGHNEPTRFTPNISTKKERS